MARMHCCEAWSATARNNPLSTPRAAATVMAEHMFPPGLLHKMVASAAAAAAGPAQAGAGTRRQACSQGAPGGGGRSPTSTRKMARRGHRDTHFMAATRILAHEWGRKKTRANTHAHASFSMARVQIHCGSARRRTPGHINMPASHLRRWRRCTLRLPHAGARDGWQQVPANAIRNLDLLVIPDRCYVYSSGLRMARTRAAAVATAAQ